MREDIDLSTDEPSGFRWPFRLFQKKVNRTKRYWIATLVVTGVIVALGVTFIAILVALILDNSFG